MKKLPAGVSHFDNLIVSAAENFSKVHAEVVRTGDIPSKNGGSTKTAADFFFFFFWMKEFK